MKCWQKAILCAGAAWAYREVAMLVDDWQRAAELREWAKWLQMAGRTWQAKETDQ